MLEVKWAPTSKLYDSNMNVGLTNPLFTPVLTLDQIEAWLKQENHTCPTVAAMLAQVQAWRGEK